MAKFAVYFVPEQSHALYTHGTAILGYDVRSGNVHTPPPPITPFDQSWVRLARPYGFHATIGDAIDFQCDINDVEREVGELLACFKPDSQFMLTLQGTDHQFIKFRGHSDRPGDLVLRFNPNWELRVFHALVAARVNTKGTGSVYSADLKTRTKAHELARIRTFHSWSILDSWAPHFTVLNPYPTDPDKHLLDQLQGLFGAFSTVLVDRISVLVQKTGGGNWAIHKEFIQDSSGLWS